MTPTLPQLIAELKAVEVKATKGRWVCVPEPSDGDFPFSVLKETRPGWVSGLPGAIHVHEPDGRLIALSRNILPHLIAAFEKQAEELKLWRDQDFAAQDKGSHCKEDPCPICTAAVDTDLATQSMLAAWQGVKEKA